MPCNCAEYVETAGNILPIATDRLTDRPGGWWTSRLRESPPPSPPTLPPNKTIFHSNGFQSTHTTVKCYLDSCRKLQKKGPAAMPSYPPPRPLALIPNNVPPPAHVPSKSWQGSLPTLGKTGQTAAAKTPPPMETAPAAMQRTRQKKTHGWVCTVSLSSSLNDSGFRPIYRLQNKFHDPSKSYRPG